MKRIFLFFLLIMVLSSCQDPPTYKIGDTEYYLVGSEWKTYIGYREVVGSEEMFLNVYNPQGDTIIHEVFWTNDKIFICLTVGNKEVDTLSIENINSINIPVPMDDPYILLDHTIEGCKILNDDGTRWFGKL